jgi:hypothetical protein
LTRWRDVMARLLTRVLSRPSAGTNSPPAEETPLSTSWALMKNVRRITDLGAIDAPIGCRPDLPPLRPLPGPNPDGVIGWFSAVDELPGRMLG